MVCRAQAGGICIFSGKVMEKDLQNEILFERITQRLIEIGRAVASREISIKCSYYLMAF